MNVISSNLLNNNVTLNKNKLPNNKNYLLNQPTKDSVSFSGFSGIKKPFILEKIRDPKMDEIIARLKKINDAKTNFKFNNEKSEDFSKFWEQRGYRFEQGGTARKQAIEQESMGIFKQYGEDLGDISTLTEEKLKKAYRALAMKYHPDRDPDDKEAFKAINAANDALIKHISSK